MGTEKPQQTVYLIASSSGRHKIGMTKDIFHRMRHLQSSAECVLQVVSTYPREAGDARLVERMAHHLLAEKRGQGEWFAVSQTEAEAAIMQAISLVESGQAQLPRARDGKASVVIWLSEEDRMAFKIAALRAGLTMQEAAMQALSMWMQSQGHQWP